MRIPSPWPRHKGLSRDPPESDSCPCSARGSGIAEECGKGVVGLCCEGRDQEHPIAAPCAMGQSRAANTGTMPYAIILFLARSGSQERLNEHRGG